MNMFGQVAEVDPANPTRINDLQLQPSPTTPFTFEATRDGIDYSIHYADQGGQLAITVGIRNHSDHDFSPLAARVTLGINTEMIKYPDWRGQFFPTLIRAEKTHLWGYLQTPLGRILAFGSPEPMASWQYDYNGDHRIYTVSLDPIHALPLPARHPQDLTMIKPGESKEWTIKLMPVDSLNDVKPTLAAALGVPMIGADRYTVSQGESVRVRVDPIINDFKITSPAGKTYDVVYSETELSRDRVISFADGPGVYTLKVSNAAGKTAEAMFCVRQPWSWYMKQAAQEGLRVPPAQTHHAESFYTFFSYILAQKYFPDAERDKKAEENTQFVLSALWDPKLRLMAIPTDCKCGRERIQDAGAMGAYFALRHSVTHNLEDLENAASLADFLVSKQKEDGAYYARGGKVHYTSVVYQAKSILDIAAEEAAVGDLKWQERAARHRKSAQAALEDLARQKDNIDTEGQLTFEDGMISCTALQLAMGALRETDPALKEKYKAAAIEVDRLHTCLTQMLNPDCRASGATLRFWETNYGVNLMSDMMNSPDGWSAWKIYSTYYLYLLTGEEHYLVQTMNALGTCAQLIDGQTGRLRFCFTQDPYIRTKQWLPSEENPAIPKPKPVRVGEQYVDMVSDWLKRPNKSWRAVWGIDNQVHEVFKCMGEVALTNAYVIERPTGGIVGYNCSVTQHDGTLVITPSESVITRIHLNLLKTHDVRASFSSSPTPTAGTYDKGLQWIGPGGVPENLR